MGDRLECHMSLEAAEFEACVVDPSSSGRWSFSLRLDSTSNCFPEAERKFSKIYKLHLRRMQGFMIQDIHHSTVSSAPYLLRSELPTSTSPEKNTS
jgi:hypothetical protein